MGCPSGSSKTGVKSVGQLLVITGPRFSLMSIGSDSLDSPGTGVLFVTPFLRMAGVPSEVGWPFVALITPIVPHPFPALVRIAAASQALKYYQRFSSHGYVSDPSVKEYGDYS